MKQFIQPKRHGEMPDTARISKGAKVRPEDIKVKAESKGDSGGKGIVAGHRGL